MNDLAAWLNKKEIAVIEGWCEGLTNQEIADVMRISRNYVSIIGHRMLPKIGATSARHATYLWAMERNSGSKLQAVASAKLQLV